MEYKNTKSKESKSETLKLKVCSLNSHQPFLQ